MAETTYPKDDPRKQIPTQRRFLKACSIAMNLALEARRTELQCPRWEKDAAAAKLRESGGGGVQGDELKLILQQAR